MFLSKLQILGFKSFPQKTELHFDKGMTAIVGPNGCGKTNILDGIRWVLGEQRTTLLRSSKMEEVIFNGTKDLKPLGMAEVSLIIENSQGLLPVDYDQVTVTRRLFRSGESEYLLNKNPCRLRDITELFLDTGVGIHAYSVMQPEMVEAILSDKAEERRFLFEEAAGITKYKVRRKEAERKLEHTESDLLRLGDILREVEKQTNSLRRQKGKAARYKKLTEEIRELEIKIGCSEYHVFKEKEAELEGKFKNLADQTQKATADLDKQEAEVEQLRLRLLEKEKESNSLQKVINELSEKGFEIEREMSISRERRSNLQQLIEKNKEEIQNLETRLSSAKTEREAKEAQQGELSAQIESKENACQQVDKTLLSNDEKLASCKERLESLSSEWQETSDKLNQLKNERESTKTQIEELKQRETMFSEEMDSIRRKIGEVSERLESHAFRDEDKRKALEGKVRELALLKESIEQNQSDLAEIASREGKIRAALEGDKAKLEMLRQISEHYEGYGQGEKSVLSAKDWLPGIIDTVANLINTDAEYLQAVESVLGASLQFIVCRDVQSALKAIQYLKEQKAGRATFLPLDKINARELDPRRIDLKDHPGAVGWAVDLVRCEGDYKNVVHLLLGDVILVKSMQDASQLASEIESGFHLAAPEGEIIKTEGVITGGSPGEVSLLGRELEIQRLQEQVRQSTERLDQVEVDKREKESEGETLQQRFSQTSLEVEERKTDIQKSEIDTKTIEFEKESLGKRQSELESLIGETAGRIEKLTRETETRDPAVAELEAQKENLSSLTQEEKQLLERTEASHTDVFRKANQLRIELVSLQGKEEQIISEQTRLTELISEMENTKAAKQKESERSAAEIQKIIQAIGEKEGELKKSFERIEQEKANLNSLMEDQTRLQESLSTRDNDLKASRASREKVQEELHQLDMEKVELSSRAKNVKGRIWEEYQVDLEKLDLEEALKIEQMVGQKEELDGLKEKLKSIGPVNLLALEEFQVAKERLDFLQNQVKDLTEAKETLSSTIAKINQTARTLFTETFEQIKIKFQKVFQELFEGGETDLSLAEEADPLESPIMISARPYGKRLLNISQLSGGEKALTAIALLFAIYLVKPSPFCILDEVDAPLDDANVTRFLKLIKHFSPTTQFILITHNKLTMEAADILYGVTMEQPGVSKIVSVKFEKHEVVTREA
ncbi:MAG: chromosome segregation protein SMC [Candidatus Zixiibacteriota bacterium]|nr:MAG: chromosome segregation protein SMC [candidate division Zixibacteria bacterium]